MPDAPPPPGAASSPSGSPPPGSPPGASPPPGFGLFKLFCLASILLQGVMFCLGGLGYWLSTNPFRDIHGLDFAGLATAMFWCAILLFAMTLPLIVAYAVAPFLPRQPWVWKFNLGLIGLGVVTPIFFLAIPAGKRWAEEPIRAWYGVPPPEDQG